jgi:hypothetical protein
MDKRAGHAVVVVGMRRAGGRNWAPVREITELIVHDPALGPYLKRPMHECLDATASWSTYVLQNQGAQPGHSPPDAQSTIQMIFVTEAKITRPAADCIDVIEDRDSDAWERFFALPRDEQAPADAQRALGPDCDYRVMLVHRRDILKTFAVSHYDAATQFRRREREPHSPEAQRIDFLTRELSSVPMAWYWAVCAYELGRLAVLWLFDSGGTAGTVWEAKIEFP